MTVEERVTAEEQRTPDPALACEPVGDGADRDPARLAVLREVTRAAVLLLDSGATPPAALSVRCGDVAVELGWAREPVGPAAPAPAPAPAGSVEANAVAVEAAADRSAAEAASTGLAVVSPSVGTFYRAPAPGEEPFVREGVTVVAGQQVGIVEAMKLMIPVEADRSGRVVAVLREDGTPVEYGEPLFRLEPLT